MAVNPWFEGGVQQTLEQYIPLPLDTLATVGQAVQQRYDTNMATLDQASTGLASIESRLPAHREYVSNYANQFRQESEALLDKYNGRADDPQFTRELRQLTNRYANDPNLQTILQSNRMYDANAATRQKLMEQGQRFIDTTGRTTGIDDQGRIVADTGTVRATNFDEDLRTMFRDTLKATINDGRGTVTNEQAVANTAQTLMAGGMNNPVIREAVEYYTSQNMSSEEALQQVQRDIQREAGSALTRDTDWGYDSSRRGWANVAIAQENAALSRERLNFEQAKEFAKQDRAGAMIALNSAVEVKNLNKELIKETDKAISQINSNSKAFTMIPDTPENRAKYPNATPVSQKAAGSAGVGARGMSPMLRLDDQQTIQNRNEFVNSARSEISNILLSKGINPNTASDKVVLENYKEYLQADNNAPTFWSSPVKEISENITRQYIGTNGENLGDAVIVNKKGKGERVANGDVDLSKLKGFDFTGITTSPVTGDGYDIPGGAIKGTAVDDRGNIVTIYKPLPPALQQATMLSNNTDRAATSGLNNTQLRQDPSFRILNGKIAPQKVGGTIKYYEVDNNGNIVGSEFDPAQIQSIIDREKASISEYFSLHQNTD